MRTEGARCYCLDCESEALGVLLEFLFLRRKYSPKPMGKVTMDTDTQTIVSSHDSFLFLVSLPTKQIETDTIIARITQFMICTVEVDICIL